jgi:hypothetical protein
MLLKVCFSKALPVAIAVSKKTTNTTTTIHQYASKLAVRGGGLSYSWLELPVNVYRNNTANRKFQLKHFKSVVRVKKTNLGVVLME